MKAARERWTLAALLVVAMAAAAAADPQAPSAPRQQPAWPDPTTLANRRLAAEARRLFATETPLPFTLTADFKAVNRDRNPKSTTMFPATLTVTQADGTPVTMPVRIRTRGHVRRLQQTCSFAPLRVEFDAQHVAGTIFEGHRSLKLGTHCREADLYEQYVPREYAAYRIFNLMTPRSFRARLANASYIDAASGKPLANRQAIFIEDDGDVARRLEGRITDVQKLTFRGVNLDSLMLFTLFEYMIGNTDLSMYVQHNVRIVEMPDGALHPVPYDFDYSGLVNARYAVPAKQLNLTSVRERLYIGPCRQAAEFEPVLARMRAVRPDVLALFETIPGLDNGYRKDAQKYLDKFYETTSTTAGIRRALMDSCNRIGM